MSRVEYGVDEDGKRGDESGKGVLCAPADKAENFLPISYSNRRPSDLAAGKRSEKNEKHILRGLSLTSFAASTFAGLSVGGG